MYTFKELKKASKLEIDGRKNKIAVLGNSATQFFALSIAGYAKLEGINLEVFDADYNQIDAQLVDKGSETYRFEPDEILLWLSTEKLYEDYLDLSYSLKKEFADSVIQKLRNYWDLIRKNSKARIIQPNFTEIDDKVLGSYSIKNENTFSYQIRKLNYLLEEAMLSRNDVYPVDFLAIQIAEGTSRFFDSALYYNAKMAVSLDSLPRIAGATVDVIKAMEGKIKKCIITDLDNTLWGGVVGDDGLGGIEIGELGRGHAFWVLQKWLKQLKERGIILAVCSKNNEEIAKEPFEKLDEMVLKLSDFAIFVANWDDKASNIRVIQKTLNIGMDSIVFLDDNPFERNLVRGAIPDIEIPELPEDPAEYLSFLQACNYFETTSFTGTGEDRTSQYQAEYERKKAETTFDSIDDYLRSLGMKGESRHFVPIRFSRIAQLTQRSNQFNLRTIRYTEDEIERIANDSDYITRYFTLQDKFGDYGLVSIAIIKKEGSGIGFIDTWLMSCRVLKRSMEEFIVNEIINCAQSEGLTALRAEYIPTAKNAMVSCIYKDFGFSETEDNQYIIKLSDYIPKKTFIEKIGGDA